ncbi:MAG: hypothetical protein CVU00_00235 [Bacteroidetes bacterium HGW-Bacteroidetes-17]|jgi:hypothetical protein|nr:MAG: hypothetical protein CVU00_00235 [Bacteroidetes bacterium HGW-Bacteroidetes-17]
MKRIFFLLFSVIITISVFSQAKKPTIMIVPSDNWCIKNGYSMTRDIMGSARTFPDYRMALQQETDLLLVIGKINTLMADRSFPLKNLESVMNTIETQGAELSMLTSNSGSDIAETPIDVLKRTANADIIIQLNYVINQSGPKRSITFMLQGIDAYTNKQIAGAQGTGEPSFASETAILLEEAVLAHLDNFNARLQDHFNDLLTNGREIVFQARVWDSSPFNLEEEFDWNGEILELGEIIEDWVSVNTVEGRFNTSNYTENQILFEQVRIALYDDRGRAQDTRRWIRDLRTLIGNPPFSSPAKIYTRGLGEIWLIIGEK